MTRKRLIVIGLLSTMVIAFVLFSSHGLLSRWRLTGDRDQLVNEIGVMKVQEDSLRTLIHTLESDTLEIERLARERYGYHRPGEKVYLIKRNDND